MNEHLDKPPSTPPRVVPADARCIGCGYDLFGLHESICPECGREFDPGDHRTMAFKGRQSRLSWFLSRRFPWILTVGACILSAMTCYSESVPGVMFGIGMLAGLLWLVVGFLYVLALALSIRPGIFEFVEGRWRLDRAALRRWSMPVAVVIVTLAMLGLHVPLLARLWLSRSDMESLVQLVRAGSPVRSGWQTVGLYTISNVQQIGDGVSFDVRGGGFLDIWGFAYLSKPPAGPSGRRQYFHLAGNWYTYRERF